ncbi:MAG: adenylate/guanylate cyclase domain-containing protein [Gemmatimonadota bacterium]
MTTSERSLASILFTDIVGSTKHATELGDRKWRQLLEEHHARVRRELRRFGGRELNISGDGFLAVFEGPARAIACADALRQAIRDLNLETRCGIHTGEVEGSGKTVGGIGVHIAARVMAEAAPGEILVSRSVRDSVEGSGIGFEDRGPRILKGVEGERRLYAVTSVPADISRGRPTAGPVRALVRRPLFAGIVAGALVLLGILYATRRDTVADLTPEEALASGAAPGIAVLPFEARGQDLEFWREGAVDLLSTNLDGSGGLRAIHPRTILARWRERVPENAGSDLPTALEVARATGARYALVGSAVPLGQSVRLVADVYDLKRGTSLGQVRVEGDPDSLAALTDRLSVDVLKVVLGGGTEDLRIDLAGVTTSSPVALRAYLEGETLFRRSRFDAAFAAYERAIDADSTFALALSRMAESCSWGPTTGDVPCEEYGERAIRFIDRLPPRPAEHLRARYSTFTEAIDPLRQAVRRYPDDPEMAYLLGEALYHAWDQALLEQDDARPFFERAVRLDPTVAVYYLHLVDRAIIEKDSARAAALVERYGRIAAGSHFDRVHRLALALAFGDSATHRRARAAMDTTSTDVLDYAIRGFLGSPRMLSTQAEALRILRARPDFPPRRAAIGSLINLLRQGRLRAAESALEDSLPQDWRSWGTYQLHRAGLDVAARRLEPHLAVPPPDTAPGILRLLAAGAYAADRGRWSDHAAAIYLARTEAQRQTSGGDSLAARPYVGAARALEGYALWRRGRGAEAVPILESVQKGLRGDGDASRVNAAVRMWLWEIRVELDRPREALIYVRTFPEIWVVTFGGEIEARFASGQIYQQLGDHDRARAAYEDVLVAWRDADPELRPRIEAAREGLARLPKPLRREPP